jgi:hypothetical protein
MKTNWVCQICKEPIAEPKPNGVVEVINIDINLDPIGSYPVEASKGPGEGDTPFPEQKIGFVARHVDCIRDQDQQGYVIGISTIQTLESWIGWILHLEEKTWMSRYDLLRMLEFWWTHKGEHAPTI